MGKINARKADALRQELQPLSVRIDEIAGKHGLARSTILRHISLLGPGRVLIPVVSLERWNEQLREGLGK